MVDLDEEVRLAPDAKVWETLFRHLDNILPVCRHRIAIGAAKGINSKIMAIKRRACGYRNREHFKTAIYFFCGGLDRYPNRPEPGYPRKTRKSLIF